jgi:hypothetical protein
MDWLTTGDVLDLKLESPSYLAVMLCVPEAKVDVA